METHVRIVALGNMLYGGLGLLVAAALLFGFSIAGLASGDLFGGLLLGTVGVVAGVVVALMSLPRILGGLGLLARKNWSRYVLGIVSAIGLFEFPVGTALSGYSLWVLFNDDTRRLTSG